MRMVWYELRKIWNSRILLVVALLCTLFYWLFMSFYIDFFPNGHPAIEEFEYSNELLDRYGPTLEEDEYVEFISANREKVIAEMERYIKSNPVFANVGISSYEDYERVDKKQNPTEAETEALWTLFGKESNFVGFKLQTIEWIENQYRDYPRYVSELMLEATNQKEIDRLNAILETKEYTNIMEWEVYINTVRYTVYLAILSILAVFVLVSPLIVTDRARNVHLLQYSSKHGRKILQKQLLAVLLSAFMLTTLLILIFGAIYSTNGTWVFWHSGMTSFLNGPIFLFDITYGQYIVLYIVLLYTLCLGTAAMAFLFSRFSRNLITLILKLMPMFAVLTVLCLYVFNDPFSMNNSLYKALGMIGIEPLVCGGVFIVFLAVSLYFVRREKEVEVI